MLARDYQHESDEQKHNIPSLVNTYAGEATSSLKTNHPSSTFTNDTSEPAESTLNPHLPQNDEHRARLQKMMDNVLKTRKLDSLLNEEVYEGEGEDAVDASYELDDEDGANNFDSEDRSDNHNGDMVQPDKQERQFEFVNANQVLKSAMAGQDVNKGSDRNDNNDNNLATSEGAVGGLVGSHTEPASHQKESDRAYIGHVIKRRVVDGAAIEEDIEVEAELLGFSQKGSMDDLTVVKDDSIAPATGEEAVVESKDTATLSAVSTLQQQEAGDEAAVKDVLAEILLQAASIAANELAASQHAISVADSIMAKDAPSTTDALPLEDMLEDDDEEDVTENSENQLQEALPASNSERSIMEEVFMSAFEPGINSKVQLVVNVIFVFLFLSLSALAVMTGGSLHVIALLGISAVLFATLQWFVHEIGVAKQDQHVKAD